MAPSPPCYLGAPRAPRSFTPLRSWPAVTGECPDTTQSLSHGPDLLLSRLEAVDKFALYGRQHAHVDHLSGIEKATTVTLQSTLLLQEDGQLAAKLDDVVYLIDGLLELVRTPRARLAQTRSVLELVQLVQAPHLLQAVELSCQRRNIRNKRKLLLVRLKDTSDEMSRLSLSVLVYFLSKSDDTEDYFDAQVVAAIVYALKQENEQKEVKNAAVSDTKSTKKCLKRKQAETLETSTTQVLDEFCQMQLDEILQDHEVFYAGDELQVSVVTTLCAALYNLLLVDGPSSSSTALLQPSGDVAEDSSQRVQDRKRQLMRSGGLNVLAVELVKQVYRLEELLPSTQKDKVTVECARFLYHINSVLRVFDQATFLTVDVQQYVSRQRNIFAVLLKLIKLLSELSWGREARTRWGVEVSRMSLVVEVLLSALRVLLNLTHHNTEAAGHVHALEGMQLLVNAFSQAWGVMETHKLQSSTQKKNEFDSCLLLLSVMVNSIELSEENRDTLAASSCGGGAMPAQAGCDLFAQFFTSTIETYQHLIDRPEALGTSGAFSGEDSDDWSPEDVILGGCTSLVLGYLMRASAANNTAVLRAMPDGSPRLLLRALAVFAAFHSQIGALTPEVAKSVLLIEKVLKASGGGGSNESDLVETMASKNSVESQWSGVSTPSLRTQAMKNLCSNLDDSDEGEELHGQTQEEVAMLKRVVTLDSQNSLEIGMRTPTRFPLRTPGRKRARAKSPVKTPVSEASSRSQRTRRSSPIAVLPDGSLSSPVVARLLKRTRQLVEEFDAEFGQASRSSPTKMRRDMSDRGTVASERSPSPCMVFTLDVTCRDNGSDVLDLSEDTEKEKDTYNDTATGKEVQTARPSKRKTKSVRDPDINAIGAIAPFDFFVSSTPSTPLRVKKGTAVLQTPTKATRSPDVYRQSPSLNLTPTKSSPSTPMRLKKASGLLRTPTRNGLKDSPASASQLRRKSKAVRPLSTCSSSIFDFKD